MPWKPKTYRPAGARTETERKAEYDRRRESANARGYNSEWRAVRARVLDEEPLCRHCAQAGYTTPSSEVDHIIPHKGNRKLFRDRSNLQALCKSCHSRKTAREDSRFAAPSTTIPRHLPRG